MLLTKQQRFLLDALERAGALRRDQMAALLRPVFCAEKPEAAQKVTDAALRQLEYCNVRLRAENGVFYPGAVETNPRVVDAVDVMLQLSGGAPAEFSRPEPPLLLRFCLCEQKARAFSVADLEANIRGIEFPPGERIILLFDGRGWPRTLPVSNKQFIAVRQENGIFRFFAGGETKS